MIYSMTGFAQAEARGELGTVGVELRSLNHRYAETYVRIPEELRAVEPRVREAIAARIRRGKLDVIIRFQPAAPAGALEFNDALATQLAEIADRAAAVFKSAAPARISDWLTWPGLVTSASADLTPLYDAVIDVLERALDDLLAFRAREGGKLRDVILERLDQVATLGRQLREGLPEIRAHQRKRLEQRIAELGETTLDPGRLEQEVAMVLQRLDVDEELDRLDAHVGEARRTLAGAKPAGRRLDFLMQEFNREANTLGSKAASESMTRTAVDLKVAIEQMREQIQNIE